MPQQPNMVVRIDSAQPAIPVNIGSTVDRTASGGLPAVSDVEINTAACGAARLTISGTWTGTVDFEWSIDDGVTWYPLTMDVDGGGTASSTTTNGAFSTEVSAYGLVRAVSNTVATGSARVFWAASTATSTVVLGMPLPAGSNNIGKVDVNSSALPAGAATASKQDAGNSSLSAVAAALDVALSTRGSEATLADVKTALGAGLPASLVGGKLDVNLGTSSMTLPVSVAALPLPNGAAKDSTLTDGSQRIGGSVAVTGAFYQVTQPVSATTLPLPAGAAKDSTLTDSSLRVGGTVAISAASLPLPSNAALETGGNLASILGQLDSKTSTLAAKTQLPGTLGQTTKAASLSVAIASDQTIPVSFTPSGTTDVNLTKVGGSAVAIGQAAMAASLPVAIASNQSSLPVTVSNSFALDSSVNGILVAQASTTSGQSGPIVQGAVTTAAPSYTTAKTSPISLTTAGAVRTDASATTQPVSGTVAVSNSFTLDATLAKLTVAQGASLSSNTQALVGGSVTTAAPTYTTGQISPLSVTTAGALRTDGSAATQPVSGTVTANIGTSGSLALDASVTALQVSQGSTTSGQKGGLGLGAVTTAPPSYTTAQSSPLSLTTGGLLRVTDPGNPTLGTAGSAASTVLSVQGIASMTPVQVSQATASNLLAQVFGGAASGALVSGNPVRIAGSDGTSTRDIRTDTSGNPIVVGGGTAGSPAGGVLTVQGSSSMSALTVAGNDGTTQRTLLTDTSGRQHVAGSSYTQIGAYSTNQVKTGPGILRRLIVGFVNAANTYAVYDNAGGGTSNVVLALTNPVFGAIECNIVFANGCNVVPSGAGGVSLTAVWD